MSIYHYNITYQAFALKRAGFFLPKLLCLTRIRTAFSGYVYYRTIITLDFLDLLEFRFCQNLFPNGFEISHSLKFAPYTQCYYLYPFRNHQNFSSKSPWIKKNGWTHFIFFDIKFSFRWLKFSLNIWFDNKIFQCNLQL